MGEERIISADELLKIVEERYKTSCGMAHRAYSNVIDDIINMPDYPNYKEKYEREANRCIELQKENMVLLGEKGK